MTILTLTKYYFKVKKSLIFPENTLTERFTLKTKHNYNTPSQTVVNFFTLTLFENENLDDNLFRPYNQSTYMFLFAVVVQGSLLSFFD